MAKKNKQTQKKEKTLREMKNMMVSFPSPRPSRLEAALLEAEAIATQNEVNVPILYTKLGNYFVLEGYPEDEADILVHCC